MIRVRTLLNYIPSFHLHHRNPVISKLCPAPSQIRTSSTNTSANIAVKAGETLTLPDARTLEYHEFSDLTGTPVLYIHGTPDSGTTLTGFPDRVAKRLGVRWIAPDRPGIGLSSPHPGRTIPDYPADVQVLIDSLCLSKIYILGTSGGAGYALACAKDLRPRSRLCGVGICAGLAPWGVGFNELSPTMRAVLDGWKEYPEAMAQLLDESIVPAAQDPDPLSTKLETLWRQSLESSFTEEERKVLLKDDALSATLNVFRRVYMHGSAAHAEEFRLLTSPWGFNVEDVAYEGVRLWYGSLDGNTPPAMGRYLAERLPKAVYREFPGKSHYSIWDEEMVERMLKDLLGSE